MQVMHAPSKHLAAWVEGQLPSHYTGRNRALDYREIILELQLVDL
jgi:hypothetical protein